MISRSRILILSMTFILGSLNLAAVNHVSIFKTANSIKLTNKSMIKQCGISARLSLSERKHQKIAYLSFDHKKSRSQCKNHPAVLSSGIYRLKLVKKDGCRSYHYMTTSRLDRSKTNYIYSLMIEDNRHYSCSDAKARRVDPVVLSLKVLDTKDNILFHKEFIASQRWYLL